MLAGAGIDALTTTPGNALPCATVAIGVLKVLLDALDRCAEGVLRTSARALGLLEDLFMAILFGNAGFTRHVEPPHPQEIAFNDTRIRVAHDLRAAVGAFHFLRPAPAC